MFGLPLFKCNWSDAAAVEVLVNPPSKYRIVPKGLESWGIQQYNKDVVIIFYDSKDYISVASADYLNYHWRKGDEEKVFLTGSLEECKATLDKVLLQDSKIDTIKAREADTSLYLDYP